MKVVVCFRYFFIAAPLLLLLLSGCQSYLTVEGTPDPAEETLVVTITGATMTPFQPLVPTATPTPIVCTDQHGVIERHQFNTDLPSGQMELRLYLPPCFQLYEKLLPEVEIRFPVLILLHGQTYTDNQWTRLGVSEAADSLIASGEAPPFLILMPLERDTFANELESDFGSLIIEALIPWVDQHYTTCTERECRAIGGISRGGGWAVRLGFSEWEYFGVVGTHSTPLSAGDLIHLQDWLDAIPSKRLPRLYQDIGKNDPYLRYATQLDRLLTQREVEHEFHKFEGTHNEEYWQLHVEDYLRWYTGEWVNGER